MVQLHATWLPPSLGPASGLFLWGVFDDVEIEDDEITEDRELPHAIPPRGLRSLLREVGDGLLYECSEELALQVLWPTVRGKPVRSGEHGTLEWWRVAGLRLPPQDCPLFLRGTAGMEIEHVQWATSMLYWQSVAHYCLRIIAGHRFVPSLTNREAAGRPTSRAVWRPVGLDEADALTFETLAAIQPRLCLAWRPDRETVVEDGSADGPRAPHRAAPRLPVGSARELLQSFLDTVVDVVIRLRLAEVGFPDRGRRRRARAQAFGGPIGSWYRALAWIDNRFELSSAPMEEFAAKVRRWNRDLVPPEPGGFRLGLRLIDPPVPGADGPWKLELFLETSDESVQRVSLHSVWASSDSTLRIGAHAFPHVQERVLLELQRAARLFRPLSRALDESTPEACELEIEEAHRLLVRGARELADAGFTVLLPEWWKAGPLKPELRLILSPTDDEPQPSGGDRGTGAGLTPSLLEYRWEVAVGETRLSTDEFRKLVEDQRPLVHLHGRWVELNEDDGRRLRKLFEESELNPRIGVAKALQLGLGGVEGLGSLPPPQIEAHGWIADLLERLRGIRSPEPIATGPEFVGTLRPYQARGVGWLAYLEECGFGACLADDMGLGKTVQLIALLLHERRRSGDGSKPGPTLVLCPMSVVGNWQREVQRFAPSLAVMIHHGLDRRRDEGFLGIADEHDVVISTYALTRRDAHLFSSVVWHRIVLDEAQNVKNPTTQQSKAVRGLRARHRVALTGTPLENRLSELWSIFDALNPGFLGTASEFRRRFAKPIEKHGDMNSRKLLHELTRPFLLRRVKTDPEIVRDLPEKLEMRIYCNLTREQAGLYQAVVDEMLGRIDSARGISRRGLILSTLTRLKQICNHPAHYLQDGSHIEGRSGKVERLSEMLEEVLAVGDRALCFTQFVEMGLILQSHLSRRFGVRVLFLHGGTSQKDRDLMVDEFQREDAESPPIFILSVRAGGTGLNLTAANHVFHFDRWWNPAVENQATDRAFRIGQRRNVQVHKFVCVGTLEERIDRIIEEKRHMAELILGSGEQWLTELSTDRLREVLTLSQDAVSEESE